MGIAIIISSFNEIKDDPTISNVIFGTIVALFISFGISWYNYGLLISSLSYFILIVSHGLLLYMIFAMLVKLDGRLEVSAIFDAIVFLAMVILSILIAIELYVSVGLIWTIVLIIPAALLFNYLAMFIVAAYTLYGIIDIELRFMLYLLDTLSKVQFLT